MKFSNENEPDVNDAYQQENCAYIELQEIGSITRTDKAPLKIEIGEKIKNVQTFVRNSIGEEDIEENETRCEYWSSDDESTSHGDMDSDLEY